MVSNQNTTMINIVPHQFEAKGISQLSEDLVIGDRLIPKGYVNLTQLVKASDKKGKRLNDYLSKTSTQDYLEALQAETIDMPPLRDFPQREIVIIVQGGNNQELQGTWADVEIAIDCAMWISPKMRLWANRVLRGVINNDFQSLTKEMKEAQKALLKEWQQIRDSGIETRKTFTQTIKESYLKRHSEADKVPFWEYSNPSDLLNILLTGHPAKYWREKFGFTTDEQLRNCWGVPQLRRIERIEELSQVFVEEDELNPLDAVKQAIATFRYGIWDEVTLLGLNDAKTRDRNRKRQAKS